MRSGGAFARSSSARSAFHPTSECAPALVTISAPETHPRIPFKRLIGASPRG